MPSLSCVQHIPKGRLGSTSNAILGDQPSLPRVNPGVANKAGALLGLPRDRQNQTCKDELLPKPCAVMPGVVSKIE